ncbi:hypothetical protein RB200_37325 [Streptomyces sp. PmtG]
MRLRRSLAAGVTAAAAALVPAAADARALPVDARPAQRGPQLPYAAQESAAACAGADFPPLAARLVKGPGTYRSGGGFGRWSVELTNTTGAVCAAVHPIVVLVDRSARLRPRQIQLEFHDGTRWRPVRFERTARDEYVGVFGGPGAVADPGGFGGFTVGPGGTVTAEVRLAFTSDARPGRVVVSAAAVQRRGDDGDWVGASGDYAFDVVDGGRPAPPLPGELASTGPDTLRGLTAAAAALVLAGGALLAVARRLRQRGH